MNLFCNFKYELIADDTRRSALSRFAGCRRAVFNKALELQNDRKAKSPSRISKWLTSSWSGSRSRRWLF